MNSNQNLEAAQWGLTAPEYEQQHREVKKFLRIKHRVGIMVTLCDQSRAILACNLCRREQECNHLHSGGIVLPGVINITLTPPLLSLSPVPSDGLNK